MDNPPYQIKVLLLIGIVIVCTVSQFKFFSKENMRENLPRQIKELLLTGMAIVCTVSQST